MALLTVKLRYCFAFSVIAACIPYVIEPLTKSVRLFHSRLYRVLYHVHVTSLTILGVTVINGSSADLD